ncbi:MAG: DUF4837 family protein [Bacteroidales bacterium]|nr:DUF4837 family protein [Candidatus Cacconaster merdequi]
MRIIKRISILAAAMLCLISCNNGKKALLPNASGKAGEVIIVIDKDAWDGTLGNDVRGLLARDCEYLPQREPLYSLVNVAAGAFGDIFKYHRNIVFFNIDPSTEKEGAVYLSDVWSHPQCLIQINAKDYDSASAILQKDGETIAEAIEQAERNRVIANTLLYEKGELAEAVDKMIGGKVHCPVGYDLKKATDNFIWIADEKQYSIQGIFVYKTPVTEEDPFSAESLIERRNTVLKENVPGMFDNTWMTTSKYVLPGIRFLKYQGRDFVEMRGLWEVENDFMGGPFVSHSFYSKDGSQIITIESWVYAAKFDKRQYLRQVESLLYSFEWDKEE